MLTWESSKICGAMGLELAPIKRIAYWPAHTLATYAAAMGRLPPEPALEFRSRLQHVCKLRRPPPRALLFLETPWSVSMRLMSHWLRLARSARAHVCSHPLRKGAPKASRRVADLTETLGRQLCAGGKQAAWLVMRGCLANGLSSDARVCAVFV